MSRGETAEHEHEHEPPFVLVLLLVLVLVFPGCSSPQAAPPPPSNEVAHPKKSPVCGVCGETISGRYVHVQAPEELSYHERCYESAPRCEGCGLPAGGARGPSLVFDDGRPCCSVCRKTAVLAPDEAARTLLAAREAARATLGIELGKIETPVSLVSKQVLLEKSGALASPRLKGLTEVEEEAGEGGKRGARRYRIWALYGLPRGTLLGVLAHELFHVFQSEKNAKTGEADAPFREGAANYVEVRVLEETGQSARARLLEKQSDPIYGEGLRRFERLAREKGERAALELGATAQRFPDGY